MQTIIRKAAADHASDNGVVLLDLENLISSAQPRKAQDDELMVDHVHLGFRGNALVAIAALEQLAGLLPEAGIRAPMDVEAEQRLRRRLLYDARARSAIVRELYRRETRPPFSARLGQAARMDSLRQSIFDLQACIRRLPAEANIELYRAAYELYKGDTILLCRLAELLIEVGEANSAAVLLRAELEKSPYDHKLRMQLAEALACSGQSDSAVAVLTDRNPYTMTRESALEEVGAVLAEHGFEDSARDIYEQVIALNAESVSALIALSALAQARNSPLEAEDYAVRALARAPQNVEAMGNMANSLVKRGKHEEAREWFVRAVEADPAHPVIRANFGICLIVGGKVAEGITHLRRAVELDPGFAQGYGILAKVYRETGHTEEADSCDWLQDIFSRYPGGATKPSSSAALPGIQ